MPEPITSLLLDMMSDTLIAQSGTFDGKRKFTSSGDPALSIPGRFERSMRKLVSRAAPGEEVVSSVIFLAGEYNNLSVEGFRYTLPDQYSTGTAAGTPIEAMDVEPVSDENGLHHEEIRFP